MTFHFILFLLSCTIAGAAQNVSDSASVEKRLGGILGTQVDTLDDKANLIYQDRHGQHWFVSREQGVYLDTGKTLRLITKVDGLPTTTVSSIQEDRSGNIYLDTPEGVVSISKNGLRVIEPTEAHPVETGWRLQDDDLWFTTGWDRNGPLRFDGTRLYQLTFPKSRLEDAFRSKHPNASHNPYGIYAVFRDRKGHLWFGTSSMGVYHFDGQHVRWMHEPHLTTTPTGGAFGIRSIAEDDSGRFWINNARYAYRIEDGDLGDNKTLRYERDRGIDLPNVENAYFLSIKADLQGGLWMATYREGIWHYDGKCVKQYKLHRDGRGVTVSSLYLTPDGELWVSTHDHGAYRFNGREFEKYVRD